MCYLIDCFLKLFLKRIIRKKLILHLKDEKSVQFLFTSN